MQALCRFGAVRLRSSPARWLLGNKVFQESIETGFEESRGLKCLLGERASKLTREAQEDPPWQSGSPGCVDVDNPLPCVVFSSNSVTRVEAQRCVFELKLGCDSASMCEMTLGILASFLVLAEARRKGQ